MEIEVFCVFRSVVLYIYFSDSIECLVLVEVFFVEFERMFLDLFGSGMNGVDF